MQIHTLPRVRTRDQVRALLRDMIVGGDLPGGERLDEIGLAARLGTSRTPVREALIALEEEGLVQSRPNHGFVVAGLDQRLVREIYPILGALEAAAVELGGDQLRQSAPHLIKLCTMLAKEKNPARRYKLDREFHRSLAAACDNTRLLHLIEQHWNHASRIDGGNVRGMANHKGSTEEHLAIAIEVERGAYASAAQLLQAHWRNGVDAVVRWIAEKS